MIEAIWVKYVKAYCSIEQQCSLHSILFSELFWLLLRSEGMELPQGIKDQAPWSTSQWTWDVKLRFCLFVPGSELFQFTASDFHGSHSGYRRERLNHGTWIRSETALKVGISTELVYQSEVPAQGSKKRWDKDVQNSKSARILLE